MGFFARPRRVYCISCSLIIFVVLLSAKTARTTH